MTTNEDLVFAKDKNTAMTIISMYLSNRFHSQYVDEVVDAINAQRKDLPPLKRKIVARSLRRLGLRTTWYGGLYFVNILPHDLETIGERYDIKTASEQENSKIPIAK
jgi:hypothetical protein